MHGGQLMLTSEVENFPGYPTGVSGPQLMDDIRQQAINNGAEVVDEDVVRMDIVGTDSNPLYELHSTSGRRVTASSVIIATGAEARWLNKKNEDIFKGKGISTCATCDGFFFRGQEVVVVGGGDSALEEALYLSKICSQVTIVHRREGFRSSRVLLSRAKNTENIRFLVNHTIQEWFASENDPTQLGGAIVRHTITGEETRLFFKGGFIAIGHTPCTQFLQKQVPLDEQGYVIVKKGSTHTALAGVFSCGDVTDKRYRQAITAASMGCMAAMDCERWLSENRTPSS
eukprot:CAMPEP_0185040694 /NCGR_PEP_ID=MMETSP1103-20130426/39044_1 /TAXON_ID=36769 /ORGANISM="Paraphysomonas bandaiensis, Strain Caron Lab Isolate" /LENGTH=285 /DNA_ID=CAMNT_0027580087 /DNA_START=218 /DNA_END=1078 /DNA_ORIENTATION=+